jgi:hypothetical protein
MPMWTVVYLCGSYKKREINFECKLRKWTITLYAVGYIVLISKSKISIGTMCNVYMHYLVHNVPCNILMTCTNVCVLIT